MKIIKVTWMDHTGIGNTKVTEDEVEEYSTLNKVETVGFLIGDFEDRVVLAQTYCIPWLDLEDKEYQHLYNIGKAMIIEIKELKE